MGAIQDSSLTDLHVLNAVLIVQNATMNLFAHNAMTDLLIFTKEAADVEMDFGMMEHSVNNAEIIVNNA